MKEGAFAYAPATSCMTPSRQKRFTQIVDSMMEVDQFGVLHENYPCDKYFKTIKNESREHGLEILEKDKGEK